MRNLFVKDAQPFRKRWATFLQKMGNFFTNDASLQHQKLSKDGD
jgi:hypothetical protein